VNEEQRVYSTATALLNAVPLLSSLYFAPAFPATNITATQPQRLDVPGVAEEGMILEGGITILEPEDGSVIFPGTQLQVTVGSQGGYSADSVLIYSDFEAKRLTTEPFTTELVVPDSASGEFTISAFALDNQGLIAQASDILVNVDFPAQLVALSASANPLYLFSAAPSMKLRIVGEYTDGIERDLSGSIGGTSYLVVDGSIATVDVEGVVSAKSIGSTTVVVMNGGHSFDVSIHVVSAPLEVSLVDDILRWPVMPDAIGYDLVVGDMVMLRSSGGDFGNSTVGCIADNLTSTEFALSSTPEVGNGFWFLVRSINPAENLSYDVTDFGITGQQGSRDQEINNAPNGCS
jgi:hypothetical protein